MRKLKEMVEKIKKGAKVVGNFIMKSVKSPYFAVKTLMGDENTKLIRLNTHEEKNPSNNIMGKFSAVLDILQFIACVATILTGGISGIVYAMVLRTLMTLTTRFEPVVVETTPVINIQEAAVVK